MAQNRQLRVFVSSTFQDMTEERDVLAKVVFPALKKRCSERGGTFVDIDLRWGVPVEENAISHCLDEVAGCRPCFIGILGERYGSVLPLPEDLVEREPWLLQNQDRSVTELEILHGVLRQPDLAHYAFFYFRDPAHPRTVRDDSGGKLADLKARIRASGRPVTENYASPEAFGNAVLRDFGELIDQLFPKTETRDFVEREAQEHTAFAHTRTRLFVGRDAQLNTLDQHVHHTDRPVILTGESGVGKSALLAKWAERYHERHPEAFVVMHFVGATPYSTDWRSLVRRLLGECQQRFGIQVEISDDSASLRQAFASTLYLAAAKGPLVIILDGLNQLEAKDQALELAWLPPELPKGLKFICSTLEGPVLDEARRRRWAEQHIPRLSADELRAYVREYLKEYGRRLSPSDLEKVAESELASNPLYLKTVLDELRVQGSYGSLSTDLAGYLAAGSVAALFDRVLERYERDYEGKRPGLVRETMSFLWVARHGLSESELLALLGRNGEPLPRAYFSPLYLAAEAGLVNRSGLLTFGHQHLGEAVARRYLTDQSDQATVRLRLAKYLSEQIQPGEKIPERVIQELPWQFFQAADWGELHDLLADLDFLATAWAEGKTDVLRYWAKLQAVLPAPPIEKLSNVFAHPEQYSADALFRLSRLLVSTGDLEHASLLLQYLRQKGADGIGQDGLALVTETLANIQIQRGALEQAVSLLDEAEELNRLDGDQPRLTVPQVNRAIIWLRMGRVNEAIDLLERLRAECEANGDRHALAHVLGNLAVAYRGTVSEEKALELGEVIERLFRELGDPHGLQASLGNRASMLLDRLRVTEALALLREQERICLALGDKDGLHHCLGIQATALRRSGDISGAMACLCRQEALCRELGDLEGLADCIGTQAVVLRDQEEFEAALELLEEQIRICRQTGDKALIAKALGNMAVIFIQTGKPARAFMTLEAQERLCHEMLLHGELAKCLGNRAMLMAHIGQEEEALETLSDATHLSRSMGILPPS
ncbi:MAG TPA: AAA family ATPase [Symbiobacteriaceae bacterium]|nr:AAA family ATPase [Symbiobacteriaceae bacterium]